MLCTVCTSMYISAVDNTLYRKLISIAFSLYVGQLFSPLILFFTIMPFPTPERCDMVEFKSHRFAATGAWPL